MVVEGNAASLARLRLFLAPHSSAEKQVHEASHAQDVEKYDQGRQVEQENSLSPPLTLETVVTPEAAPTLEAVADSVESNNHIPLETEKQVTPVIGIAREKSRDAEHPDQGTIAATGAAASVCPISSSTREFARVKYLLQCCLPGFKVQEDVMIWDMQNPSLVAQYEHHSNGLLELDSWVAVNDLGDAMADMHSYGFTSLNKNQSGMKFTTGNVSIGDSSGISKGSKQMVLCKIAVGKAFVIHREEDAKQKLPTGYNSFYLLRDGSAEVGNSDVVRSTSGYYHEYILTNTLQILPQYLVRFAFSKIDSKAAGLCALCEKHSAVVVCRACEAEICSSCDQEVHSANKLVSRHKRTPLRPNVQPEINGEGTSLPRARRRSSTPSAASLSPISGDAPNNDLLEDDLNAVVTSQLQQGLAELSASCRFHEGKSVEFYCTVCELPVCVNCKMLGDHSVGEKGSHRLLSISDAYELSLRDSLKPDPLIESRKSVINSKLKTIARWKQELTTNRDQVEAAIREQCQQTLRQLDHETSAKMQVLNGDALEFQRQLHQIEWAEDNLDDQRASAHAVTFLMTWNQHKMLRAEQRDFPTMNHGPSADHVKADLHLIGRLRVITGDPAAFTDTESCDGAVATASTCDSPIGRRPSDSDIRNKLLSMKAVVNPYQIEGSPGRTASQTGTFMSPKCAQFMEDIKNDLLTKGTVAVNSRTAAFTMAPSSQPSLASPRSIRNDATASLRGFPIHSTRRKSAPLHGSRSASKQRTFMGSDTWSTLLRQELNHHQPADKAM